jgi:hypothetical protein
MNDPLKKYIKTHREDFDSEAPDPAVWERISQGIAMKPKAPLRPLRAFRWGLAAAASVLAVVSVTLFFHARGVRDQRLIAARGVGPGTSAALPDTTGSNTAASNTATADNPASDTASVDESLYDQELYHFSRIINIKFREIEKIKWVHPELYQRFSADLQKLDTAYRQLKQQLPTQPNQELLLKAMLQNLTLQVDLINRQLGIIEQLKSVSHAMPVTHV